MKHTPEHSNDETVARILAVVLAWLGSVTLADIQIFVAILSGLSVLTYTVLNTYVLVRDKIRKGGQSQP
jgi:hypothetical protein